MLKRAYPEQHYERAFHNHFTHLVTPSRSNISRSITKNVQLPHFRPASSNPARRNLLGNSDRHHSRPEPNYRQYTSTPTRDSNEGLSISPNLP